MNGTLGKEGGEKNCRRTGSAAIRLREISAQSGKKRLSSCNQYKATDQTYFTPSYSGVIRQGKNAGGWGERRE